MMAQHEATTTAIPPPLTAWRCWRCGKVIARLFLVSGSCIEIKCKGCGAINLAAVDNGTAKP